MTNRQKNHWKSVKGTNFSQRKLPLFLETSKKSSFIVPNETNSDKLKRQKQKQNKEKEHSRSKQARALKDLDFGLIEKRFFTSSHCAAENGT